MSPANNPVPDQSEGLADPADSPQAQLDTGSENAPEADAPIPELQEENAETSLDQPSDDNA